MKKTVSILALVLALLMTVSLASGCNSGAGEEGYAFKADGITLKIGAPASVVESLDTPTAKSESPSCGGVPGLDVVYVFPGFKVCTTPAKGGDVINKIEVTDDSVKTPEGVFVGMEKAEVKKAMGNPTSENEASMVYEKGNMKLTVLLRGGAVTNIQYLEK